MDKEIKKRRLSQADMILISIYRVSRGTTKKAPFEEIIIQAWEDFPKTFSLRNHPEYPDGSVIHKRMADRLKPQGLVIGLGDSVFRLTDKGVEQAKILIDALEGTPKKEGVMYKLLSREQENYIRHAFSTQAFTAWKNGQSDRLIDYDVKLFFRFSTGTKIDERKYKVDFAKSAISKAIEIGIFEARQLDEIATYLIEKFNNLFMEEKYEQD